MARASCRVSPDSGVTYVATQHMVELRGFEPLAFSLSRPRFIDAHVSASLGTPRADSASDQH